MKHPRLPVKRRPVKKRPMRTLMANVSRKRQRAATAAAEFEGDVPNLGVARALMVILLIHVVAVAGIFVHSQWFEDKVEASAAPAAAPGPEPAAREEAWPKISSGDSIYTVGAGETWASIASRFGLTEEELKRANTSADATAPPALRNGCYLKIPPKTIAAVEPAELTAIRQRAQRPDAGVIESPAAPPVEAPSPKPAPVAPPARLETPGLVTTEAAERADAVLIRPAGGREAPAGGSSSYRVRPGDTFWAIAQRHGTTPEKLMKANGISDPRRLRVGMDLKIPD